MTTDHPIAPGQVWRRNSDGVEVEVRRVWANGSVQFRFLDPARRERYGPQVAHSFERFFTFVRVAV